jgi:hypothetical protein
MSKEMREHIDKFKDFLLKESKKDCVIYNENELKIFIKNWYNTHYQSSIKNIDLDLLDKFIKIESKHRYREKIEKQNHIEIFRNDDFDKFIKKILSYKYKDFNIETLSNKKLRVCFSVGG